MMVSVACLLMWLCVEHACEGKVITRMLYNEEINNKLSKFIDIQDNIVICMCANYLQHTRYTQHCFDVLFDTVIIFNMLVNRVLDRMFSGHFSLNVRTATIGGHVPIQHHTWPEHQPYANLQSHKGRYMFFYTVITIITYVLMWLMFQRVDILRGIKHKLPAD